MDFININGKIETADSKIVTANSRAFRFGDGVFETIKAKDGKLIHAHEHFDRLYSGLQLLHFEIPKLFTAQKLEQEIVQLLNKNKQYKLARIRLTVFRGNGGLYDAENHYANYVIQTWELPETTGMFNENGLVLGLYANAKKSCDNFCNIKHNNFLPYTMAALFAKQQKYNDAFVLNEYSNICDSTIANVFIVKDSIVSTPPLTEGCIAGITRHLLLQQLPQNNISVVEKPLNKQDILEADEVFLTNAIKNIQWVKQFENKLYTNLFTKHIHKVIF